MKDFEALNAFRRECVLKHNSINMEVSEVKARTAKLEDGQQTTRTYVDRLVIGGLAALVIGMAGILADILFRPSAKDIAAQVATTIQQSQQIQQQTKVGDTR